MDIIRGDKYSDGKAIHPIVAIGNFDGVHLGHQAILKRIVERARTAAGTSIALTFDPHPLKVLMPAMDLKFLMTFEERLDQMAGLGIQQVRCFPFTQDFANRTPLEFARTVLRDDLGAEEVFVGAAFAFGKNRAGTVRDLQRMGREMGFEVQAVEPVSVGGRAVSSSRIRVCLLEGNVAQARALLGRPYGLEGRVIPGARRGGPLGYPTANFHPPPDRVIPRDGIYAVRAELQGRLIDGATYIGTQPTLGTRERMVETHLFEPQADLYGRTLRVRFMEWIRPERAFKNPQELVRQIEEDLNHAKTILTEKRFLETGS